MGAAKVFLPDDFQVSIATVAQCIAEALHPLPAHDDWRFGMFAKSILYPNGGHYIEMNLSTDDWDKLNALFVASGLHSLGTHTPPGLSPQAYEPYRKALAGEQWREQWQPKAEFSSDQQDAQIARRTAIAEHTNALSNSVRRGDYTAYTDSRAPDLLATFTAGGHTQIRRTDAIAYIATCGLQVADTVETLSPATEPEHMRRYKRLKTLGGGHTVTKGKIRFQKFKELAALESQEKRPRHNTKTIRTDLNKAVEELAEAERSGNT